MRRSDRFISPYHNHIFQKKNQYRRLNTSASEIPGIHRFTILIDETEEVVRKLCRQIEKQVEVLKAYYDTDQEIWAGNGIVQGSD